MRTVIGPVSVEDLLSGPWPESGELWDGVFLVRSPSGGWHGVVGARLGAILLAHVERLGAGVVLDGSAGYVVARSPDRVLSPDVSFVANGDRIPVRGFVEGPPDLAVEVRSPDDTWTAVVQKGATWVAHRTPVAVCVDPLARRVSVLRPALPPEERGPGEAFSLRPTLALDLPVDDVFRGMA
jgi:Uma2 family endonuclease